MASSGPTRSKLRERLWARRTVVIAAGAGAAWAALSLGETAALAVLAAEAMLLSLALFWIPRAAHRRFVRGNYRGASFLYRLLRLLLVERRARAAVQVSLAACALARDELGAALETLGRVEPALLDEAAKAAWLNNQAYALARGGEDPAAALAHADAALALRPDVAGFHHTRGVALLALGRVDEAIRELEAVWREQTLGQETPLLEAERCFDMGLAWAGKGEREYARDYFERARRAAPGSIWARRAERRIDPDREGEVPSEALAELL